MKFNKYGQGLLTSNELIDLLLQGNSIKNINAIIDDDVELYNKYQDHLLKQNNILPVTNEENLTVDEFNLTKSQEWFMPDEYKNIDVYSWLIGKCKSQKEIDRVNEEYVLYKERDLIMLLRFFIFLVDYMRKNNHIWGVGRGSSVSSYILFLIGIHRIDSIKYNFNIKDYLK